MRAALNLLIGVLVATTVESARLTVYSGTKVRATSEYPFLTLLYTEGGRSMCSGSLVAPDLVLTAGHCVCGTSKLAIAYFATLNKGTRNLERTIVETTTTSEYKRACVLSNYGYNPNDGVSDYDMALATLNEKVSVSYFSPVKLAKLEFDRVILPDTSMRVVGFGMDVTETFRARQLGILKFGDIVSNECLGSWTKDPICISYLGGNIQNAAPGDSGGPIIYRDTGKIGGVVSGEIHYKTPNGKVVQDIYASVYGNSEFLQEYL